MTLSRTLATFVVVLLSLAAMSCAYTKAIPPTVPPTTTPPAFYWIDTKDAMAEKACTAKGGVVSTREGQKICAVQPVEVMTSFVITDINPYSAKACSDQRGVVSTNATGTSVCNLPSALRREGWTCETCNAVCRGPCFLQGDLSCVCYPTRFFILAANGGV